MVRGRRGKGNHGSLREKVLKRRRSGGFQEENRLQRETLDGRGGQNSSQHERIRQRGQRKKEEACVFCKDFVRSEGKKEMGLLFEFP